MAHQLSDDNPPKISYLRSHLPKPPPPIRYPVRRCRVPTPKPKPIHNPNPLNPKLGSSPQIRIPACFPPPPAQTLSANTSIPPSPPPPPPPPAARPASPPHAAATAA